MSALERGTDNLTAREHAHRGAILLGIGSLLVLSVSPVTGPAAWETHWATFVFRAGR